MLMNMVSMASKLQTVLDNLNRSAFEFTLTGSRAFNIANEKSDYDFYAHLGPDLGKKLFLELGRLGFRPHVYGDYKDHNCECVYRHESEPIDIQVVKNIDVKHKCDVLMKNYFLPVLAQYPKDQRYKLWNIIIKLVTDRYIYKLG